MLTAALHITTISSTDQALAALVLLLLAAATISLLLVHLLDRDVNPISMAVSEYGARRYAWFYRLAAVWLGLAGLLTAVLLADAMFPKPTLTILCLLVFAAARWAITIFPTDRMGEDATETGRAHVVLAVVAFAAIAVAAIAFAGESRYDSFWTARHDLLAALGWLLAIVGLASAATWRFAPQLFGLFERLYYVCMFAWLATVAAIVLA